MNFKRGIGGDARNRLESWLPRPFAGRNIGALAQALLFGLLTAAAAPWVSAQISNPEAPARFAPGLSPPSSPEASLAAFDLAPGFEIQLIACEPMVQDPVAIDFDESGRLWVVEMRGFMQDIDSSRDREPIGRVSVLEDIDADGRMDKSTVFADGLVLPRALECFRQGALIAEHETLSFFEDTDGDLVADERSIVDSEYARGGTVEHRPNGLCLAVDNWIYNAKSAKRYRYLDGAWEIEETERRGQWGICQDNFGRLFYNYNWSQLHCDLAPPGLLTRNRYFQPTLSTNAAVSHDQRVYPLRMNTAVNRGYLDTVLDERGRLRLFASACAPLVYRGGQFPPEFAGNAFVCGPGANVVKRNIVSISELYPTAQNGYANRDFLASTDERFRPVALAHGPEGALYVVDMYRGIIQQADHMTPYLRRESLARGLDKPIHLGRIYRIVAKERPLHPPVSFDRDRPGRLASLLQHPNGWVRDTAQRLLTEHKRGDAGFLIKQLDSINPVAALHALWILHAWDVDPFHHAAGLVAHPHRTLAGTALRHLAERAQGDAARETEILRLTEKLDLQETERAFHAALALGYLQGDGAPVMLLELGSAHAEEPLLREAIVSGLGGRESAFLAALAKHNAWREKSLGREILVQLVAASASRSGDPNAINALLELCDEDQRHWLAEPILNGMLEGLQGNEGPLLLEKPPGVAHSRLAPFLSWPGHEAPARSSTQIMSEAVQKLYARGATLYAHHCTSCHGADGKGLPVLGPPLRGSEWVIGDAEILAKILLHGLEGPIEVSGKTYGPPQTLPAMPPLAVMDDQDIAATLTYLRRAWNHRAAPVSPKLVARTRARHYGREKAWTAEELREGNSD